MNNYASKQSEEWVASKENAPNIWGAGYSVSELMDLNASSSNPYGQLVDLIWTNRISNWAVSGSTPLAEPLEYKLRIFDIWCVSELANSTIEAPSEIVFSIDQKLNHVRSSLGLSVSALAKALQTSRQSLYSWLNGDVPRDSAIKRIQSIYEIAQHWNEINHFHFVPGSLLRQPIGDTPSVMDVLSEEEIDLERAKSSLETVMELMEIKREKMNTSIAKTKGYIKPSPENAKNRRLLTKTVG